MTDTPTTAEEMREAAARIVDRRKSILEVGTELSDRIRALPCAPDPRIAALEAERDRLRGALVAVEAVMTIVAPRSDRAEYLRALDCARAALDGGTDD